MGRGFVNSALAGNSQLELSGHSLEFDVVKPHRNFRIWAHELMIILIFCNTAANIYFLYYEHLLKRRLKKLDKVEKVFLF